jgi:hypothetical protein
MGDSLHVVEPPPPGDLRPDRVFEGGFCPLHIRAPNAYEPVIARSELHPAALRDWRGQDKPAVVVRVLADQIDAARRVAYHTRSPAEKR